MESSTQNNSNELISLPDLVKTVVKHWYLFVISVICCVALAFAYAKITKDEYTVCANVMIRTDMSSTGNMAGAFMQQFGLGNLMGQGVSVDDELHVISSHSLLREAALKMGLNKTRIYKENFFNRETQYKDFAIDVIDPTMQCDTLSTTLVFKIKVDEEGKADIKVKKRFHTLANIKDTTLPAEVSTIYGNYIVTTTPDYVAGEAYNYTIRVCSFDAAAENVGKNVDIYIPDKLSNLITLSMQTAYIDYGKELLNTLTDLYNKRGIKEKNIEAINTAQFIDERLALIAHELDSAERKVEKYKQDNKLSDLEIEAKIILEQDGEFQATLLETETTAKILEYTLDFISQPENRYSLIPFSNGLDQGASDALTAYNELALKRLNLSNTAKAGSPALKILEEQIDASRQNVISTVKTALESTNIALKDLRDKEAKFYDRIRTMPTQEREFISIFRQKAIKEELYIFLLQKQEENALTLAMASPKGQIVDEAYNFVEPVSLSTTMKLAIGFLIGLILPAIYLYLRAIFQTKFSTKEEVERMTRIPILGELCTHHSSNNIVVHEGDNSSISELFRLLRTNLQFMLTGKKDKVVLLTSSVSGEGKSFVSVNLAIALSLLKKRVLIIGLDIRNPRLSEYLNVSSRFGITNYLASEEVEIDQIIVPSNINPLLDIITAGPVPPNPAELILSNRLDALFDELRNRYDYIIVDSAPVAMVSDTFSLMRIADAVIYVCRANYTQREYIRYCNNLVTDGRLHNVSLVVNATNSSQGYGYGVGPNGERIRIKLHE